MHSPRGVCGHSAAHTAPRLMRERAHGRLTHTSALAVPPVVANGPQAVGLRDEPKARLCPTWCCPPLKRTAPRLSSTPARSTRPQGTMCGGADAREGGEGSGWARHRNLLCHLSSRSDVGQRHWAHHAP